MTHKSVEELVVMTDEELIQFYMDAHKLPRLTSHMKRAKEQVNQGILKKPRYSILKEIIEIERVDGWICKFCLIQLLKRDNTLFNRFSYTYLKTDGKFQSGGQTTLMAPVDIITQLLKKYDEQSLDCE